MRDIENPAPLAGGNRAGIDDFAGGEKSRPTLPQFDTGFNYADLPRDVAGEARAAADRIKQHMRGAILEVGTELLRIKERLLHGTFGKWLAAEFGLTERTAQNYMSAAELARECETVSVLRPKTLYLLAALSTPERVRQDVLDRLNKGEHVRDAAITDAIAMAKQEAAQERQQEKERERLARLSPRARRSRASREAEWEQQKLEDQRERDKSREIASAAAEIIFETLGDRIIQLNDLLYRMKYKHYLVEALLNRVPTPQCKGSDQ